MRVVVCGLWWCVCGGAAVWRLKCSEPKIAAVLRASNSAVKHERAGVITGRFRGDGGWPFGDFLLGYIFFGVGSQSTKETPPLSAFPVRSGRTDVLRNTRASVFRH